jgi:hypothetical protein
MTTPQLLSDIARLLIQIAPALALLTLVLAGIAFRVEGGTTLAIGGGFTKWMFWAVVLITLPQLLLWFSVFGVPAPATNGDIGTTWIAALRDDVMTFVNDFVIARLAITLAAYFLIRAILDATQGNHPLPSILTAMFLLAVTTTARLISNFSTGTRFAAVDVMDGLWNYLAGRIMPIAAGLAVIAAIFNFLNHRPAMRLIAGAIGLLTVSALWKLLLTMM